MTTDFRALCVELAEKLDEFDRLLHGSQYVEHPLTYRARAAIAADRARRPAPEPPAEGEVEELVSARLRHCPTHGQQPANAWGCPECVRELRSQLKAPAQGEVGELVELVAWLMEGGEDAAANGWDYQARQFGRAAELLQRLQPISVSEPQPEPPTDEELLQIFDAACLSEGGTTDEIHLRGLRAVLARWGTQQ